MACLHMQGRRVSASCPRTRNTTLAPTLQRSAPLIYGVLPTHLVPLHAHNSQDQWGGDIEST